MLSTTNWHLPSTSERIKSHVAATPSEGSRVAIRHEALCAGEKLAKQVADS